MNNIIAFSSASASLYLSRLVANDRHAGRDPLELMRESANVPHHQMAGRLGCSEADYYLHQAIQHTKASPLTGGQVLRFAISVGINPATAASCSPLPDYTLPLYLYDAVDMVRNGPGFSASDRLQAARVLMAEEERYLSVIAEPVVGVRLKTLKSLAADHLSSVSNRRRESEQVIKKAHGTPKSAALKMTFAIHAAEISLQDPSEHADTLHHALTDIIMTLQDKVQTDYRQHEDHCWETGDFAEALFGKEDGTKAMQTVENSCPGLEEDDEAERAEVIDLLTDHVFATCRLNDIGLEQMREMEEFAGKSDRDIVHAFCIQAVNCILEGAQLRQSEDQLLHERDNVRSYSEWVGSKEGISTLNLYCNHEKWIKQADSPIMSTPSQPDMRL